MRADTIDLARLALKSGEGRRMADLAVSLEDLQLGGERYATPASVSAVLDLSRMSGGGWALRLRFSTAISGPCMRCLADAAPEIAVDAREVHEHGSDDPELVSPYVSDLDVLDLAAWARDALALALPRQVLCRPDCAGLCPVCGEDLNTAGPGHRHERPPDPRWAALRELKLD
ncbi:MAG: DUF177 domain-containing protein [Solirubrobacteraceae bacterium]|nr:DUF177 domain-containing protein [Solirubrobacteraceae bacterium]